MSNVLITFLKIVGINNKISFKNNNLIKSVILRTKDEIDVLDKIVIYRLCCIDCNTSYIGKTAIKLNTRIREHIR